ncbi:Chaperone SurA [Candidatus Profftia lariciata]|nr:Chaperone SurA [Candidatus Profftia lariciata]
MLIFSIVCCLNNTYASPQLIDRIVAVVNHNIILESDVKKFIKSIKQHTNTNNIPLYNDILLQHKVIEHLIMENIQLQIAKKHNIAITDYDVDKTIHNIIQQNNISMNNMYNSLSANKINYTAYRDQIRKEMLIATVCNNEVRSRIKILPQEIESLVKLINIQQYGINTAFNISHIFIPNSIPPVNQQLNNTEKYAIWLINQLKKGANFDKLLIHNSAISHVMTRYQLGWKNIEDLPSLFFNELHTLHKGDVIGPISSNSGLHVLQVNDIHNNQKNTYITEVNVRHILLRSSPVMTNNQAYIKLEEIRSQIKNKKMTFDQAARTISQDYISALKGGNLGWAVPTIYNPSFCNTVIHLKKGEISAPIYSPASGWHLIQLLDTRQINDTENTTKNLAYRVLFNHKFNEEIPSWMQEERAKAYVKIIDNSH